MRIDLVINASSPDVVETIRESVASLRQEGHSVHPRLTFEKGDARRFAVEAARAGSRLVVAAGGDGTLNEVGNGLHDYLTERARSGGVGPEAPRMGIVPLGTANDLAGALEIPADVKAAVAGAVSGKPHPLDVGLLNGAGFLNVSTGGIGAEATEETSDEVKRLLGPVAYFITGVRKFVALQASTASFSDGETLYEGPFMIFAVGNSRRTGGGNWLTPHAELSDGLLDVCIVKEISRRDLLGLLPDLRAGRHVDHAAVIYKQVRELRVKSEEELSVNVDGEPLGGKELHYTVSPHQLTLSLP